MRRSRSASRGRRREPERGDEERHADPDRVRAQQDRSAPDLAAARRDRERGREQRTDARAPTRAERDADDVRPRDAGDRRQLRDQPPLARQRPRAMPSSASPMTMINTPPTTRTPSSNVIERRTEQSGERAQAREHGRESGDEDERRGHRARRIVRVAHLAHDDPEVRGNERDDARREERRDTGAEQRDDLREHQLPVRRHRRLAEREVVRGRARVRSPRC